MLYYNHRLKCAICGKSSNDMLNDRDYFMFIHNKDIVYDNFRTLAPASTSYLCKKCGSNIERIIEIKHKLMNALEDARERNKPATGEEGIVGREEALRRDGEVKTGSIGRFT